MRFILQLALAPFLVLWLLFCATLAFVGGLLPRVKEAINLEEVQNFTTVCKVLNEKGLISDAEYDFETNQVASHYDRLTFKGYLFIMKPVLRIMNRFSVLDGLFLWLVQKWMDVHYFLIEKAEKPKRVYVLITHICVSIAYGVGRILDLLSQASRVKIEL